ncbi:MULTISPECIES: hypothetical protein [Tsukamurella]|uniref:Uncharacterized protein n=1 Tax=Tsukamurella strandjordii TaxID=147577 RepID=A0AA90SKI1_9ACTN|nr:MULTISPECIES: hypothetical protein [Tsukamurella]MDP0397057.1 hypothetical protein [Tsukamurella strandjordii]GIZ96858.1 hypothetical protein TTY48_14700 [Tsukamurella sp. TY48]
MRVVPATVLKLLSGGLLVITVMVFVATMLRGMGYESWSGRLSYGLALGSLLAIANLVSQVWRVAIGSSTPSVRDAQYYAAGMVAAGIPVVILWGSIGNTTPLQSIPAIASLLVAGAIAIQHYRTRKRYADQIQVPIVTRTVATQLGERAIRIGQPQSAQDRWITWWSVTGLPSGYLLQPAYGPDSMTSLAAALTAAEAAATTTPDSAPS